MKKITKMGNIQDVMDFFSELTQNILSAFHLFNDDDTIYDDKVHRYVPAV